MSYEIVKSIKIDTKVNKVFITCASSNVSPKIYDRCESSILSADLEKMGKEYVIKEILLAYYKGEFQTGTENNYSMTVKAFRNMEKFKIFNKGEYKREDYDLLKEDLWNAYNLVLELKKGKSECVISYVDYTKRYIIDIKNKKYSCAITYAYEKNYAKKFKNQFMAEFLIETKLKFRFDYDFKIELV